MGEHVKSQRAQMELRLERLKHREAVKKCDAAARAAVDATAAANEALAAAAAARRAALLVNGGALLRRILAFAPGAGAHRVCRHWRAALRAARVLASRRSEAARWARMRAHAGVAEGGGGDLASCHGDARRASGAGLCAARAVFARVSSVRTPPGEAPGIVAAADDDLIELDLHRTSRARNLRPLRRVLRAVCVLHADVGYCQGLNVVAAALLRRSAGDAAESFEILACFYEVLDLRAVYAPAMPRLRLCLYQLERLLAAHRPRLKRVLDGLDAAPELYATSWFVTLLVSFLPDALCGDAWERLLASTGGRAASPTIGWAVVFRFVLGALGLAEERLLGLEDDGALRALQAFGSGPPPEGVVYDAESILAAAAPAEKERTLEAQLDALQDAYDAQSAAAHPVRRALDRHAPALSSLFARPRAATRAVSLDVGSGFS